MDPSNLRTTKFLMLSFVASSLAESINPLEVILKNPAFKRNSPRKGTSEGGQCAGSSSERRKWGDGFKILAPTLTCAVTESRASPPTH